MPAIISSGFRRLSRYRAGSRPKTASKQTKDPKPTSPPEICPATFWNTVSLSPLRLLLLASLLVYSAGAAQAGWQDRATALDQKRLAALGEARTKALAEANAGGGAGDARAIHEALDARSHAPTVGEVAGSWRCRTIKLGGMTPYVVYSWFKCRVEARGDELRFEKITGSQLTSGVLYPS